MRLVCNLFLRGAVALAVCVAAPLGAARPVAAPAPAPASSAPEPSALVPSSVPARDATALLRDPHFKADYLRALGPLVRERWLKRLDGPATPPRRVVLAGVEYEMIAVCKRHDCHEHNLVLVYDAATRALYARLRLGDRARVLGAPPPALAGALEDLWRTEWRPEH